MSSYSHVFRCLVVSASAFKLQSGYGAERHTLDNMFEGLCLGFGLGLGLHLGLGLIVVFVFGLIIM